MVHYGPTVRPCSILWYPIPSTPGTYPIYSWGISMDIWLITVSLYSSTLSIHTLLPITPYIVT